jgi:sulfite reductase (NADPH) flavoprotein alpha-component
MVLELADTALGFVTEEAPFDAAQRIWLDGYLAGMLNGAELAGSGQPPPVAAPARPLAVVFATQTGTAESLARKTAKQARGRGFAAAVIDAAEASAAELAGAGTLLVIASTYGDGEPPDAAEPLWAELRRADAPRFDRVSFAVLALGDSSYRHFCAFGHALDERLAALGGTRLCPCTDCDVDLEPFTGWQERWPAAVGAAVVDGGPGNGVVADIGFGAALSVVSNGEGAYEDEPDPGAGYDAADPFPAMLRESRALTAADSEKDIRHVVVDIGGSGIAYRPGDALGVLPCNDPAMADEVLAAAGCAAGEPVDCGDGVWPLREALLRRLDLTRPRAALAERLGMPGERAGGGVDVLDLLRAAAPGVLTAQELVAALAPLRPRLYSIASSQRAAADEVHLTIAMVHWVAAGRARDGVCSTYLGLRAAAGEEVQVYLHANRNFRLPEDDQAPIVMIGPGTGIAPFRSFLQERQERGAAGARSWLLFGNPHRATDFLYRDELQAWLRDGTLGRLTTAFSRDQADKVYVQHRIVEHGAELYRWLQEGAHLYVCGDAERMAPDVDAALRQVIADHGGGGADAAADYLLDLKRARRYQRDVY